MEHWWKLLKTNIVILRVFNVYGSRCKDTPGDGNVVGIFYKKFLQKSLQFMGMESKQEILFI